MYKNNSRDSTKIKGCSLLQLQSQIEIESNDYPFSKISS